jgi:hypothetical protein
MDRPHQPHVIRTWTVERTRHPVRENFAHFTPATKSRKAVVHPENRPPKVEPAKK